MSIRYIWRRIEESILWTLSDFIRRSSLWCSGIVSEAEQPVQYDSGGLWSEWITEEWFLLSSCWLFYFWLSLPSWRARTYPWSPTASKVGDFSIDSIKYLLFVIEWVCKKRVGPPSLCEEIHHKQVDLLGEDWLHALEQWQWKSASCWMIIQELDIRSRLDVLPDRMSSNFWLFGGWLMNPSLSKTCTKRNPSILHGSTVKCMNESVVWQSLSRASAITKWCIGI